MKKIELAPPLHIKHKEFPLSPLFILKSLPTKSQEINMCVSGSGNTTASASTLTWRECVRALPEKSWAKTVNVAKMGKKLAQDDPRRIIHSFKVGLALVLISTFYCFEPVFDGFEGNTTWAVITVVVVMEFSVGATLGKGLNRMLATLLAGALSVAAHSVATLPEEKAGRAVLISFFVFLIGGTVTFIRFFPPLKARYDYGLLIFILTFSMISVPGYRDSKLREIARDRVLTIIIGSCIAITVSIFIFPVWVGEDLHNLIAANMEKLADFLEGFGDEYFDNSGNMEAKGNKPLLQGYKSVLSSKSNEETMANLARWEPRHGQFRLCHPWKVYLKVGNLTRECAYKIEALHAHVHSNCGQSEQEVRSKIQEACKNISSESGKALKELSLTVRKMAISSTLNVHLVNAKNAAESLAFILRTNPWEGADLFRIIPAAAVASLLIDVVISTEKMCEAVNELESLAKFKSAQTAESSQLLPRVTVQAISGPDGSIGSDHVIAIAGE